MRRFRKPGRKSNRSFSMLIHDYFTSPEYAELSPRAVKALIDLYCQFRGGNNGDLCAAWSVMAPLGWTSKDQLSKALHELIERGWIICTRQGGKRVSSLYAVTFLGIDHCGGKLEIRANPVPTNLWKTAKVPALSVSRPTGQCVPPHGSIERAEPALCPAPRVNTA